MPDQPSYKIEVSSRHVDLPVPPHCLNEVAEATLRHHDVISADLSVVIVDDTKMAELNKHHLNHTGPTDVLTFDLRDDLNAPEHSDGPTRIEGEIVISHDTAKREAAKREHPIQDELALYVVHGILHLLGFDDHEQGDAARMHSIEDDILESVGLSRIFGTRPD